MFFVALCGLAANQCCIAWVSWGRNFPQEETRLRESVTAKLQQEMEQHFRSLASQIDDAQETQDSLSNRQSASEKDLQRLRDELHAYETHNRSLDQSIEAVEAWLAEREAEEEARGGGSENVEDKVQPANKLSAQLVRLVAEINTEEDVIDSLFMALEEGILTADEFVPEVRRRARRQFESKALVDKINRALAEQQSSSAGSPGHSHHPPVSSGIGGGLPVASSGAPPAYGAPAATASSSPSSAHPPRTNQSLPPAYATSHYPRPPMPGPAYPTAAVNGSMPGTQQGHRGGRMYPRPYL